MQFRDTPAYEERIEPICIACESESNLRHVERGEVCWKDERTAHCTKHGELTSDEFRTIRI